MNWCAVFSWRYLEMSTIDPQLFQGLSKPAQRALLHANIHSLQQLSEWTEKEVGALHGMGPKGIAMLKESLAQHHLSFREKENFSK